MVAIADVDALVPAGSAIDAHARANTTTVYTAAGIFSMIPERLSTDLTSLNQDEDRLAMIVQMDVSEDGTVGAGDVYRGRVRNRARLSYDEVAAWLDGGSATPGAVASVPGLAANIELQDRVAQAMKDSRHRHGALTLDTIEATVVFAGDELTGLKRDARNRAKELIEDFMIAANTVTATFLERRGLPSIRRVLRSPARWDRIVALAHSLGDSLPPAPSAGSARLSRAPPHGRSGEVCRSLALGREAPRCREIRGRASRQVGAMGTSASPSRITPTRRLPIGASPIS